MLSNFCVTGERKLNLCVKGLNFLLSFSSISHTDFYNCFRTMTD